MAPWPYFNGTPPQMAPSCSQANEGMGSRQPRCIA